METALLATAAVVDMDGKGSGVQCMHFGSVGGSGPRSGPPDLKSLNFDGAHRQNLGTTKSQYYDNTQGRFGHNWGGSGIWGSW